MSETNNLNSEEKLKSKIEELQKQLETQEDLVALKDEAIFRMSLLNQLAKTSDYLKGIGLNLTEIGKILELQVSKTALPMPKIGSAIQEAEELDEADEEEEEEDEEEKQIKEEVKHELSSPVKRTLFRK